MPESGEVVPAPSTKARLRLTASSSTLSRAEAAKAAGLRTGIKIKASPHVLQPDFGQQPLEDDRALELVAVVGPKRDQPAAGHGVGPDKHGEGNQMIAPQAVVLEGYPIVAAAWPAEIELTGLNDLACHVCPGPLPEDDDRSIFTIYRYTEFSQLAEWSGSLARSLSIPPKKLPKFLKAGD